MERLRSQLEGKELPADDEVLAILKSSNRTNRPKLDGSTLSLIKKEEGEPDCEMRE